MGTRITSVTSPAFDDLFASFKHTAYRLETLQVYDVSYEIEPYRAFLAGRPRPHDASKNAWTAMLERATRGGKIVQRVHLVDEPLTDYLRYELEWSYPPNIEAGEDIRILPAVGIPGITAADVARLRTLGDYWLFDSSDLWAMEYDREGRFLAIEQVTDPARIVTRTYWRDAALHYAEGYGEFMIHKSMQELARARAS